ncbi:MAG: hypothetical protein ACOC3C_06365, partial [Candidatus Thorarchaeota archaeon]
MKVPGTTVSLALLPGRVELRDEGRIKKEISTKSKSFEEIVKEVKSYFHFFDKRFPPGHIEDVLRKIGVGKELKRTKATAEERSHAAPEGEIEEPLPEAESSKGDILTKARVAGKEVGDISEALAAVESMSDTFRSPKATKEAKTPSSVQVKLSSQKEIVASAASLPKQSRQQKEIISTKMESETPQANVESIKTDTARPVKTGTEESDGSSRHVIKPVVQKKCLLVGEENVGKRSLVKAAGLELVNDEKDFIYHGMFKTNDYRVDLHVWSFDDAVDHRLPRKEYYGNADVAIVAYSACDRWSFESLNFWIKELSISEEVLPPLIITGNKYDKKMEQGPEESGEFVTEKEGFIYAENLATELGKDNDF